MIFTIAKKEFTEMLRDGRFRWSAGIVFVLLVGALLAGWRHYEDVKAQHLQAQQAERNLWLNQGSKNPHSAAHYGVYAFKPKVSLSAVDRGLDPYLGVAVWLEAHRQNQFQFRPVEDATPVQRFGELTAATTLQVFLPLLIVLLAFSAFAGEREQGTLRQLLSLGLRSKTLALGKALGIAGALSVLLIPAAIVGALALLLAAESRDAAAEFPRVALLALSYLLYFGVFVFLALMISAKAASARAALVVLLGFWFVNCFVAPRVMAAIVKHAHPTPSAFAFQEALDHDFRGGIDGHNPYDQRRKELETRVLAQYGVESLAALPVNFDAIAMQEGEKYGNLVFDKHFNRLFDTFEQQNRVYALGGLAAPLLAMQSLSMGFTATDFLHHRHFTDAAEEYRRALVELMNKDMEVNSKTGDWQYKAGPTLWQKAPAFAYTAPGVGWVLRHHAGNLAVLLILFIATGAACLLAVGRIEIA
jgi:ABC-2 type transport system permease protein